MVNHIFFLEKEIARWWHFVILFSVYQFNIIILRVRFTFIALIQFRRSLAFQKFRRISRHREGAGRNCTINVTRSRFHLWKSLDSIQLPTNFIGIQVKIVLKITNSFFDHNFRYVKRIVKISLKVLRHLNRDAMYVSWSPIVFTNEKKKKKINSNRFNW